jgi:ribosomal protein S18 acetylase RimI-like enzyme
MVLNFELFKDSDYNDLKDMILQLYQEDPEGEPMSITKIDDTVKEYKINPNKVSIYMLKSQGGNIGYAILVYFWSNEYGGNIVTIDELYINKSHRGKGISTEFLSLVEKLENIVAIQLEVTPSNQRTLSYYKRLGFLPSQNTHLIKQKSTSFTL